MAVSWTPSTEQVENMGKRLERIFGLSPMKIEADSLLVEQFGADTAIVKCTAVDIISTQDAFDLIAGAPLPDEASADATPAERRADAAEALIDKMTASQGFFSRLTTAERRATELSAIVEKVREHAAQWANRPPTSPYAMGLRDAWRTILSKIDAEGTTPEPVEPPVTDPSIRSTLAFTPDEDQLRTAYWHFVDRLGTNLYRRDLDAEFTRGMERIKARVRADALREAQELVAADGYFCPALDDRIEREAGQ